MQVLKHLTSRSLKYGYSNARVKGMKGLLLKGGLLDEMIRVGTIEGMVELLQRTGYKNDLTTASLSYSGSSLIENAASRNFARSVRKLISFMPKDEKPALTALLTRWDMMNIKTLMRAKRLGKSYEEVKPYLFEVGGLTENDFKTIMKADEQTTLKELRRTYLVSKILLMGTKQKRMNLANALRSMDSFLQMESAMDAYIYLLMDEALSGVGGKEIASIREILRNEIDAKNIMIIERLKRHNASKEKIINSLIQGGSMKQTLIERLIDTKELQSVEALIRPKFHPLDLKDKLSLTELEIALEKSIAARKLLSFHRAVLSAGVVIGFLLLKEEEINNLRKISKGKEFKIPESEVRAMLVVV